MGHVLILIFVQLLLRRTLAHVNYDTPSSLLVDVNEDNLDEFINSSPYCLLDFYVKRADMASPTDPTTTTSTFVVAAENPAPERLKFGKIETKANPTICEKIGIRATIFPTKVLFKDGKIIDIIDPTQRHLYYPELLRSWLIKRVIGPFLPLTQFPKQLEKSQAAAVLLGTSSENPVFTQISLKMMEVMFYSGSRDQLPGSMDGVGEQGVYVIRNFIGQSSVEKVDVTDEENTLRELKTLTTPAVVMLDFQAFATIQIADQWMLGLSLSRSKPSHRGIEETLISALEQLNTMVGPGQVRGVLFDLDKSDDFHERMINFFDLPNDLPTVFSFKRTSGNDLRKAKMETELTAYNMKEFLFGEVQRLYKDQKAEKEKEEAIKENEETFKDRKASEPVPHNWQGARVKPIVRSTAKEWVEQSGSKLLILLCYTAQTPDLSRALLKYSKLQRKFGELADFGKINTSENEVEFEIPVMGIVSLRSASHNTISSTVISESQWDMEALERWIIIQTSKTEL